jgi:hypothetical protein
MRVVIAHRFYVQTFESQDIKSPHVFDVINLDTVDSGMRSIFCFTNRRNVSYDAELDLHIAEERKYLFQLSQHDDRNRD